MLVSVPYNIKICYEILRDTGQTVPPVILIQGPCNGFHHS
uniref:Uncharacterized protein n=1 Tax=Anguilla anguilla TaxID=7936 RepID=A0A0E9UZL0_ANGAN